MITLSWEKMHKQSRELALINVGINKNFANKHWNEIEEWMQLQINDVVIIKSKNKVIIEK